MDGGQNNLVIPMHFIRFHCDVMFDLIRSSRLHVGQTSK